MCECRSKGLECSANFRLHHLDFSNYSSLLGGPCLSRREEKVFLSPSQHRSELGHCAISGTTWRAFSLVHNKCVLLVKGVDVTHQLPIE